MADHEDYLDLEPLKAQGAISLSLTNSLTHPPDPTSSIEVALLIYERIAASEPQIEVSLTHA